MYERVLDEGQIARDIVDAIRSTTDAPLSSCIEAAKSCMAVMAPYIQVEAFSRIQEAVGSYAVKVDDCYDYRLLSEMEERLTPLFKEKYELSYSSEQDDEILIKYLQMFSSCALKTDPKVVAYLISTDDYQLVDHLINIYQMDQNNAIRLASLSCIVSLVDVCTDLITYLLNSRLPEVMALQFQSQSSTISKLDLTAIKLLTTIYSTEETPPLHHFDLFDVSLFTKLLLHFDECPPEILDFLVNFNGLIGESQQNPIIAALNESPCTPLGQSLVKLVNDQTTERRLKLVNDIIEEDNLHNQLFYSNDLDVLSNVLAREYINSESKKVRSQCMKCICRLAELGHCNETAREVLDNSDLSMWNATYV